MTLGKTEKNILKLFEKKQFLTGNSIAKELGLKNIPYRSLKMLMDKRYIWKDGARHYYITEHNWRSISGDKQKRYSDIMKFMEDNKETIINSFEENVLYLAESSFISSQIKNDINEFYDQLIVSEFSVIMDDLGYDPDGQEAQYLTTYDGKKELIKMFISSARNLETKEMISKGMLELFEKESKQYLD